jgi:hypothetical protein
VSVVFEESSVCMFSMFYIRFMGKFYHSCDIAQSLYYLNCLLSFVCV